MEKDKFYQLFTENTPQEMKEKSLALNKAINRSRKADKQVSLWIKEQEACSDLVKACQEDYSQASLRWDVETGTMTQLEVRAE